MGADATYINQAVYHKQGGNEQVIASGGKQTVESGGEVELQSGSILDLQDGFNFYLGSSSFTAGLTEAKRAMYENIRVIEYKAASASVANGAILPSQIYNTAKFHVILPGSNAVANTLWLASAPSVGMEMIIAIGNMSASTTNLGQSTLITISCSGYGGFLHPVTNAETSVIKLISSIASHGKIHMVCLQDGLWSVISISSATAVTF
jgi:hypothetical protein